MRISVLGPVRADVAGAPVELGGHKQRLLLAVLLCAHGRPVSVDRIIDQVWDGAPPSRVMASLQAYVANLRRALEPERPPRAPADVLVTRSPGYALVLPDDAVDAWDFEAELATGRALLTDDPVQARDVLIRALQRWQGPAYGDLPDRSAVVATEATRLESLRLTAVENRWAAEIVAGSPAAAVAELEALIDEQPLRESLWVLLVRALYAARGQAEALDAVRRAKELLVTQLGLDPGPELQRVEQAVLQQDPVMSVRSTHQRVDLAGLRQDPSLAPSSGSAVGTGLPTQRGARAKQTAVVGRGPVMAELEAAVDRVAQGRGQVVVLSGEPGIGKTHLARAVLDSLVPPEWRRGWGSWEAGDGTPALWPWARALQEVTAGLEPAHLRGLLGSSATSLSPLLPGLADESPERRDSDSATFQTATAVVELLGSLSDQAGGCAVVLDDVQWADADSLRLLRRLATELHRIPALVVLTCRDSADAPPDLVAALAELTRADAVRLRLRGLTTPDVATWIAEDRTTAVDLELAEAVRERTDGNPFYVGELVRLLASESRLTDSGAVRRAQVPDGVKDVVRRRVAQLPGAAAPVLGVAAVAGRVFDLDVVEAVVGDPTLVEDGLVPAVQHGLVEEDSAPGRYRFVHALVHETLYVDVPGPRRARLHGEVAATVEELRLGRVNEHLTELAQHYRLAGRAQARAAWTFAARAAEQALERGAAGEAARLFTHALDSLADDPLATPTERYQTYVGLGRAWHGLRRMTQCWTALREAALIALEEGDPVAAADALLVITQQALWTWREYLAFDPDAVQLWQDVVDALPPCERRRRALSQAALALELLSDPASVDRRIRLAERSLATVDLTDEDDAVTSLIQVVHVVLQRPDLGPQRLPLSEALVSRARHTHDAAQLADALCKRGSDFAESGRWRAALDDFRLAQDLAVRHQLLSARLVSGWALLLALQAEGRLAEAEQGIDELARLQASVTMPGAALPLAQLTGIRLLQGRAGELEQALRAGAVTQQALRDVLAVHLVESGRTDEVPGFLGAWHEQPPIPVDYLWSGITCLRAMAWAYLDAPEAHRDLRAALSPHADQLAAGGMAAVFLGSVHHTLGELALAADDLDTAGEHLTAAIEVHERNGLLPWLARSQGRLAEAHARNGREGDARASRQAAERLAADLGTALPPPLQAPAPPARSRALPRGPHGVGAPRAGAQGAAEGAT